MKLELSNYISIVALLFSMGSVTLSILTYRFNRYIKGVEIRSNLLIKMTDLKGKVIDLKNYIANLKLEAEMNNDLKLYKLACSLSHYENVERKIDDQLKKVSLADPALATRMYELTNHDYHDLLVSYEASKRNIESIVDSHKKINEFK